MQLQKKDRIRYDNIFGNGAVLVSYCKAPLRLWFVILFGSPLFKENKYKLNWQQSKSVAVIRRMRDAS